MSLSALPECRPNPKKPFALATFVLVLITVSDANTKLLKYVGANVTKCFDVHLLIVQMILGTDKDVMSHASFCCVAIIFNHFRTLLVVVDSFPIHLPGLFMVCGCCRDFLNHKHGSSSTGAPESLHSDHGGIVYHSMYSPQCISVKSHLRGPGTTSHGTSALRAMHSVSPTAADRLMGPGMQRVQCRTYSGCNILYHYVFFGGQALAPYGRVVQCVRVLHA